MYEPNFATTEFIDMISKMQQLILTLLVIHQVSSKQIDNVSIFQSWLYEAIK